MKINRFPILMIIFILALALANPVQADKFTDTIQVFKKSEAVQPFFKNAYGYAVFPTIGKAGIGIGGSYGTGQVYKGGKVTGEVSVIKGSIGWQLGGQAFSQMIFFKDKRAYDEFTSGNFEFDATASAVAITAGAQASAGTEGGSAGASAGPATGKQAKTSYHKGMVVFTHAKGGLMYEASIGGQKFTFKPKKYIEKKKRLVWAHTLKVTI
jgi:lipid-binding SYLF domain-containing protein